MPALLRRVEALQQAQEQFHRPGGRPRDLGDGADRVFVRGTAGQARQGVPPRDRIGVMLGQQAECDAFMERLVAAL